MLIVPNLIHIASLALLLGHGTLVLDHVVELTIYDALL